MRSQEQQKASKGHENENGPLSEEKVIDKTCDHSPYQTSDEGDEQNCRRDPTLILLVHAEKLWVAQQVNNLHIDVPTNACHDEKHVKDGEQVPASCLFLQFDTQESIFGHLRLDRTVQILIA